MSKPTPKQLAMLWLYERVQPERVDPRGETLARLAGASLTERERKETLAQIEKEIERIRGRCRDYLERQGLRETAEARMQAR